MFSELKALIDSERFRVIVFQYRAKNDNSELGIFTSKHDPICKSKIPSYRFSVQGMHRAKNDDSELGIHLRTNSEILSFPRIPSYRYGHGKMYLTLTII